MDIPAATAMSMASAAPFSGLRRPAKTAPRPLATDHGMSAVGTVGSNTASTGTISRQALSWNAETVAMAGGRAPDGGRIEGVVVDNVVPVLLHLRIRDAERFRDGRQGGPGRRPGRFGSAIEGASEPVRISTRIDHGDAGDCRS